MAHNRKLAIWAIFLHFKDHKPYQWALGTLEVIIKGSKTRPGPSMDPTGTLKWTQRFSEKIPGFPHLLYIVHSATPLNILENFFGHCGTLPGPRGPSRAVMDHHGPPNGLQNGPCEANFRGPLVKKGPPGPLHGPN